MNFLIGCCEKQPIRKLGKKLRSYEKENRSLIPAGDKVPIFINTQLIHQFAFRHADAVNLVLLRAGITQKENSTFSSQLCPYFYGK